MSKTFFDIHTHVLNIHHPSLIEFIRRNKLVFLLLLGLAAIPGVEKLLIKLKCKWLTFIMNTLSLMDHSLGDYLCKMEDDIVNGINDNENGSQKYDKIVITPLMMDFGKRHTERFNNIHYNLVSKPIIDQTIDLFNGIKYYKTLRPQGKLEVYPFIGITPKYMCECEVKKVLEQYFERFGLWSRRKYLEVKMGTFDGNIVNLREYSFAGIKVYPPLGYDPWPDNYKERRKVRLIYDICVEKNIPIITHCGYTGYNTIKKSDSKDFTDPLKWEIVLKQDEYQKLKICFAHFGAAFKLHKIDKWKKTIARLAIEYDNVYFDIGARCYTDKDYKTFFSLITRLADTNNVDIDKLFSKALFASDLMMCLLKIDSYESYIKVFMNTNMLKDEVKEEMCSKNPNKFLFGE